MSRSIVITGSHLTPALAVIKELKKRNHWEIYYLGRKHNFEGSKTPSVESQILPSMGIKFIPIPAGRLQRKFTRYTIFSLLRIPWGMLSSLKQLLKIRPSIVCSFGGYVSVPVIFSTWLLGIPSLTHEQTTVLGLANKINAIFSKKIAVSFKSSLPLFPSKKVIFTGNPIRSEIFKAGQSLFPLDQNKKTIYITGGSQGASVVNEAVFEALPQLIKTYNIIHQCGGKDFPVLSQKRQTLPSSWQKHYFLIDYIKLSSIGWVFKKADLVVSRGGANTISELIALEKPGLIIPIPWATHNEQFKNAQLLKENHLGEILSQEKLNSQTLTQKIRQMIKNHHRYRGNKLPIKKIPSHQAAKLIVDTLYDLLP